jgi:hypothetical protein
MSRNPLLACDVLLRQCDQSFSNGATGYSPESSSIKWDHLKSRPEGIDCMQLAQMVTRVYLQKQGDLTGVTMSNINNLPAARQEVAERYDACLLNDSNKARGEENNMKFKEFVAFANVLVAQGQPSHLASILHIAKFSLHPFETSRASLYKSAVAEKVEAKAVRTVNDIQTSAKGQSSMSNSKDSDLFAQVASLQTPFKSMQKAFPKAPASAPTYNRSPPPTSYTASSPYPPIAVGRGPLSKGSRNCAPPSDGVGLPPNLGFTNWDDSLWRRARANVSGFARLALHPTCAAALPKCRPCDESMMKPRIDDIPPVASGVA